MTEFVFHTEPFPHQREDFERSKDLKTFALFWEQGLGKSKGIIDTTRYLYEQDKIDAMVLVAPSGIERNWVSDEFPKHLPPDFDWQAMLWHTPTASKYWADVRTSLREFIADRAGLRILCMSYHAFLHKRGMQALRMFLEERRCLMMLDESDEIASPSAKWSRRAVRFGRKALYRRIGTGTPTGDGTPLAYYQQFAFLSPQIIDAPTFHAFKQRYAEWEPRDFGRPTPVMVQKVDPTTGKKVYKNLDHLQSRIAIRMSRRTKESEQLKLPAKLYDKVYFELTPQQRKLYDRVREEYMLDWPDNREQAITLVLTRRIRLLQIACGFYPADKERDEPERRIAGDQPRLEAALYQIRRATSPITVWARWRMDLDLLAEELRNAKIDFVRYDGTCSADDREYAKHQFQSGAVSVFLGNPSVGGRGLTFIHSHRSLYYSNSDRLRPRIQSEDRQHRIGQVNPVLYTDIVAVDTVDELVLRNLRNKQEDADAVTGDDPKEWL